MVFKLAWLEQQLHSADVNSEANQVGGKQVPEGVRMNIKASHSVIFMGRPHFLLITRIKYPM